MSIMKAQNFRILERIILDSEKQTIVSAAVKEL